MKEYEVIVIGGGPAGLMAAGQAATLGANTLLLEKMDRPGRKLRITGKGRCNLTNSADLSDAIGHFGSNGRFLRQSFSSFYNTELISFFNELGISTVTERGGRVFPANGQARKVADALVQWIINRGVTLKTNAHVKRLLIDQGHVTGVWAMHDSSGKRPSKEQKYTAGSIIITSGGASYPATGSTGDGYGLAESAGHDIKKIRPALVPLETSGDVARKLQDLNLRNVAVRLRINGKKIAELFGEISFTHFGVTGPIALTFSRRIVDALHLGQEVILSIDLKPALDARKLDTRLLRDFDLHGKQQFRSLLKGLLPKKLIPVCTEYTDIAPDKAGHQITSAERKRLKTWIKDFRMEVTGHRSFSEAIVTAGGINLREVDPAKMTSRLVKGLYFAGEVLDLDADTGGYNLQAAFSTGWIAGRSAANA